MQKVPPIDLSVWAGALIAASLVGTAAAAQAAVFGAVHFVLLALTVPRTTRPVGLRILGRAGLLPHAGEAAWTAIKDVVSAGLAGTFLYLLFRFTAAVESPGMFSLLTQAAVLGAVLAVRRIARAAPHTAQTAEAVHTLPSLRRTSPSESERALRDRIRTLEGEARLLREQLNRLRTSRAPEAPSSAEWQSRRREIVLAFLEVVDSIDRGIRYASGADPASVSAGLEITLRQALHALETVGVRPIDCVGKKFDPKFHEAVETVPANTCGRPEWTVVEELRRGYVMDGGVLRPSQVRVSVP